MPGGLLGGGMLKTLCRRACVTPLTGSGVSPPGGHWDTPGHAVLSEVPIGNSAASGLGSHPSVYVGLYPVHTRPTGNITPCATTSSLIRMSYPALRANVSNPQTLTELT